MKNTNHSTKTLLVLVTGFLVLYLIFKWIYFLYIAAGIGVLSIISERLGNGIVYVWDKFGQALAWLNSRILLSIIFFVVLTPFAWLARLRKHNPVREKRQLEKTGSYYKVRNYQYTGADLEEMW